MKIFLIVGLRVFASILNANPGELKLVNDPTSSILEFNELNFAPDLRYHANHKHNHASHSTMHSKKPIKAYLSAFTDLPLLYDSGNRIQFNKMDFELDKIINVEYHLDEFTFETYLELESGIVLYGDHLTQFHKGELVEIKYSDNKRKLTLHQKGDKHPHIFFCITDDPCRLYKHI